MPLETVEPYRVLIVDDEPDMLVILGTIMESFGNFKAFRAADGYCASYMVLKNDYDLILLDVMMPGINGMEVCKTLRGQPKTSAVPIIMVSAVNDMDVVLEAHKCGANDYILKPFDSKILRKKVEQLLHIEHTEMEYKALVSDDLEPDSDEVYVPEETNQAPDDSSTPEVEPEKKSNDSKADIPTKEPIYQPEVPKTFREEVFEKIEEISFLPIMPETLMTMKKNAFRAANDLKEPIASDIGFAYNTIQVANSAFYSPDQPIANIFWAISVIGERTIMDNVKRMIQSKQLVTDVLREHLGNGFLSSYLSRAFAAKFIAEQEPGGNPDDSYSAGLMQYMGEFFLLNYFPDRYKKIIANCHNGKGALLELEREELGLTHYDISNILMRKGNMPPALKDFISYFVSDKRNQASEAFKLFQIAHLADYACCILGFSYGQEPFLPQPPACLKSYNRFGEYVQKLFTQVMQQVDYNTQMLDLPDPSISRDRYNNDRCLLIGKGIYTPALLLLLEYLNLQIMTVDWANFKSINEIKHSCVIVDASNVSDLRIEQYKGTTWDSKGIVIGPEDKKHSLATELFPACKVLASPLRRKEFVETLATVVR